MDELLCLKTAPRILICSIAMGAKPSFWLKSIATWALAFFMHNNSFIATVHKSSVKICQLVSLSTAACTYDVQLYYTHCLKTKFKSTVKSQEN